MRAQGVLLCLAVLSLTSLQVLLFLMVMALSVDMIPGKTLYVIAHPDDEAMFFGPSILRSEAPFILSLSEGAPDGETRVKEFFGSCEVLGLEHSCFVDKHALPDGFEYNWTSEGILHIVNKYIDLVEPDRIVTFDGYGVSGHPNHVAIPRALAQVSSTEEEHEGDPFRVNATKKSRKRIVTEYGKVPVYFLQTGPVFAKYLGFPGTILYAAWAGARVHDGFVAVTPLFDIATMRLERAFRQHKSQRVWYRALWLATSRFLSSNHLVPYV